MGEGEIGKFNPFRFFSPFPQVNLSIGRFVYFPTFLRRIFSLFLKFVETSRKVENENFGDGGNELEPSTYRDTRIFLWSVHLRVENKSEVGPGLSGYCRVELPSPGVDAFSRGILCVFLLRKRGGRVRLLKFAEKLKGMKNSVNRWKYRYSIREKYKFFSDLDIQSFIEYLILHDQWRYSIK